MFFESKVSCLKSTCQVRVKGNCQKKYFSNRYIERYYFSEEFVGDLAFAPPNSSIEISVSNSGEMRTTAFFVGELSLNEWLKKQKKTKPLCPNCTQVAVFILHFIMIAQMQHLILR